MYYRVFSSASLPIGRVKCFQLLPNVPCGGRGITLYLAEDYSRQWREKGDFGQTRSTLPPIYLEDSIKWMAEWADIKITK